MTDHDAVLAALQDACAEDRHVRITRRNMPDIIGYVHRLLFSQREWSYMMEGERYYRDMADVTSVTEVPNEEE